MQKVVVRGVSIPSDHTKPLRPTVGHSREVGVNDGFPEGKPGGRSERPPTQREIADEAKWRDIQRDMRMAAVPWAPNADILLATIEPLAKDYYDLSQDLENTLQLSQAISLAASVPGGGGANVAPNPAVVAGETFVDESTG